MPFFEYNQNNSGGSFVFNDRVTHLVIIEAENAEAADNRAESIGVYFNGCADNRDCSCCGDRWHTTWGNGTDEPMAYGVPVAEAPNTGSNWTPMKWRTDGAEIYVYRKGANLPEPYWVS